jgi:pimeloyl-ACP methyl ester carboxylesterase
MTTQETEQQRSERAADAPASGTQTQANVGRMETVISRDGTRIAYRRSGEGPPLILVHGAAANHGRWSPVLPSLEEHFTVYAVDRRGRGGSGDSDGYAIEQEFEDVAAVIDSIGESVNLLGHSYGALLALEAALLTRNIRKLVLYDPGIEAGEEIYPHEVIERLEALLEAGDRDGVVATTMREVAGLPPETVEHLRTLPVWQTRVAAAHTIPRELRAVKAYRFDPVQGSRGADAATKRRLQPGCPQKGRRDRERGAAGLPHRRHARTGARGHGYRNGPLHGESPALSYGRCATGSYPIQGLIPRPEVTELRKSANGYQWKGQIYDVSQNKSSY